MLCTAGASSSSEQMEGRPIPSLSFDRKPRYNLCRFTTTSRAHEKTSSTMLRTSSQARPSRLSPYTPRSSWSYCAHKRTVSRRSIHRWVGVARPNVSLTPWISSVSSSIAERVERQSLTTRHRPSIRPALGQVCHLLSKELPEGGRRILDTRCHMSEDQ